MRNADKQSEIFSLQLQIKIKKQIFDDAIRGDKEFSEVKKFTSNGKNWKKSWRLISINLKSSLINSFCIPLKHEKITL